MGDLTKMFHILREQCGEREASVVLEGERERKERGGGEVEGEEEEEVRLQYTPRPYYTQIQYTLTKYTSTDIGIYRVCV